MVLGRIKLVLFPMTQHYLAVLVTLVGKPILPKETALLNHYLVRTDAYVRAHNSVRRISDLSNIL